MNERQENLFRAARLIRRLDAIQGMSTFEGVPLKDIALDCSQAAQDLKVAEIQQEILTMYREPDTHSRKVETEERTFRVLDGGAA